VGGRIVTPDETLDLLSIAAAYDKRTVGTADVHAWSDSARRCRWTYPEAAEAIKVYYATSVAERPWVMPSHVTQWIKAHRQDQHMRAQTRALTEPPRRVVRAVAEIARSTELPAAEPREPRQPALRVQCPHCEASPGESCTRPSARGRRIPVKPHPSRLESAKEALR